MNTIHRTIAATQVVLILPATAFLAAVLARALQPPRLEPALTAEQIVDLYAGRQWTLWILLIAMPLSALLAGGVTLLGNRNQEPERRMAAPQPPDSSTLSPSIRMIVGATLTAGLILAVVAVHMLAN